MTNDTRHSDQIERDIAVERSQMSDTINDLQKKFSVDGIVGDLGDMFRNQGGDLGRAVTQTVGRNPMAVALVGVGLAWLFVGSGRNRSAETGDGRWDESGDGSDGRSGYGSPEERSATAYSHDNGLTPELDDYWYGSDESRHDRRRRHRGSKGGNRKTGLLETIKDGTGAVGDSISGAADNLGQAASGLTERMSHGLEHLSDEARTRVLAARRAAHDARRASAAAVRKGVRASSNFFEDQPLVVGALALAIGAAMGGALPHSKIEDDTLGDSSDRLFDEAQALFRQERDKALAAVKNAASDAQGEIRDLGSDIAGQMPEGKTVGEALVDRASEAAMRIVGNATDRSQG